MTTCTPCHPSDGSSITVLMILTDYAKSNPHVAAHTVKLGASSNYSPAAQVTNLVGPIVYQTSARSVHNSANRFFSLILDSSIGDFSFGEFGLFSSTGHLLAIGVISTPLTKLSDGLHRRGNHFNFLLKIVDGSLGEDDDCNHHHHHDHCPDEVHNSVFSLPTVDDTASAAIYRRPDLLLFVVTSPISSSSNELITYSYEKGFSLIGWDTRIASGKLSAGVDTQSFVVNQFVENLIDQANSQIAPVQYLGQMIVKITSGPNKGLIRIVNAVDNTGSNPKFTVFTPFEFPITGVQDFEILSRDYDFPTDLSLDVASGNLTLTQRSHTSTVNLLDLFVSDSIVSNDNSTVLFRALKP